MPDLGVRLQLFVGPTVPIPAPYPVVDALRSVEVTNNDRERDGFQMTFTLGKDTPLDYTLLATGLLDPPARVVIMVIIDALPQVLIDGVVTQHQFAPSNRPGESALHVTGEDISVVMDFEEKSTTHPNQPDSVIALKLISDYTVPYGIVPMVTPTTDVPIVLERTPTQQGTDLSKVRSLAEKNGFVFYVEPTVPGTSIGYWGPDNRLTIPQPALTMNMGADTNVDSPINFQYNALGPVDPQVTIVEPITKLRIPVPTPSGLRPPLARSPATPLRKSVDRDAANLSPSQGLLRAVSASTASSEAVTATGEVDAVRYGRALQSRKLVGVRGVGQSYDGLYYVQRVTHRIKLGEYKQSFTLSREGRGTLTPVVIP